MTDESSDNDLAWWMPPDRPDPAEPEDVVELGPVDATRPIGPMSLRNPARRPYLLAGVAAAALLAGGGAALAAGNSAAPAAARNAVTSTPVPVASAAGPGTRHRFFSGLGMHGFGMVHGQFVVAKSGGGYQTVDVQDGQVTAVSVMSVTLKSPDGFTKTYTVTSSTMVDAQRDGIGSVKVGNQASVLATVSGSAVTATNIADQTLLQQGHPGFGNWQGSGGGAQPG